MSARRKSVPQGAGLHAAASAGFRDAHRYDVARPDYPEDAVEWLAAALALGPAVRVLDLGAGTGKLSDLVAPRCGSLVAVEPIAEMRRALSHRVPRVQAVAGVAQALPLRDGAVGAVVCGQSFHWFATTPALAEIHRVLAPRGRLGLLWNQRDESRPWVRELGELLRPLEGDAPRFRTGRWRDPFEASTLFSPLASKDFANEQAGPPERIVERIATTSIVAALPEDRRAGVLEAVRAIAQREAGADGQVTLPYVTHAYWCERR
ncbi:MAG TPA: class I SAM-dependent methyltransferase [Anaeromyxobacteraceae bacterium]|nr:class I SAM-dependent methyltransferase [Anaeromyxobacteraceae bacterium]